MKKGYAWLIGVMLAFLVILCIVLLVLFANQYLEANNHITDVASCNRKGHSYIVTFENGIVSPVIVNAHLCDTLTFVNKEKVVILLAFGPHAHHIPYDNVEEKILATNEILTLTLNKAGVFQFHNHLDVRAHGEFVVTQ